MAQQRLDAPTTTIQPTPGTSPVDIQAEQALAGQQARSAIALQQVADQVQTTATTVMRDESLKQAQRDAAQVVTVDDVEGKRGWGGLIYNEAYTKGAVAQYSGLALTEAQGKANEILTRNPNNPDAVRAELTIYLDGKKKAMPDYLSDAMTPHYAGVLTGAVSSATAGQARGNLASLEKTSKDQLNGLILDYSNTYGSAAFNKATPADKEATNASFGQRWKIIEAQMLTYMTPQAVARVKAEADALVQANVLGADVQQRAAAMARDPVGIQKLREENEQWAKDPVRSQYYAQNSATLENYLQRGAQMAGAVEQAIVIDQQFKMGAIQDKVAVLADGQKGPNRLPPEQYEAAMTAIRQQALQAGIGRLPGQQAQLLAAAGDSGPALQQMYGTAMLQASGRAMFGATPEVRLQGLEEVRGIVQDPNVLRQSSTSTVMAGLVQQGQKILATAAGDAGIPDQIALAGKLQSRDITQKDLPQLYANATAANLVGNAPGQMTPQQFAAHSQIGLAKNKEYQTDLANSQAALNRGSPPPDSKANAEPLRAEEIAALQKTHPDKFFTMGADGKATEVKFNPSLPAHMDQAVSTVARAFYLPDAAKNWVSSLSSTSSSDDQQKAVSLYDRVNQVVAQKYADLPQALRAGKIFEATKAVMGDDAAKRVYAFKQAPGDAKAIEALMKIDNPGRQQSKDDADTYAEFLTKGLSQGYTGGQPSLFTQTVRGGAEFLSKFSPSDSGREWLRSLSVFENQALAAATSSLPQFRGELANLGTPKPGNIMVDNNALQMLNVLGSGPGGYMQIHGGANESQGYDKRQQAFIKTLQDHPDKFAMVWSVDPKTGDHRAVLTYRDFRAEFNNTWRQPGQKDFTDNEIKSAALLLQQVKSPYHGNQMDPDTVSFRTEVQPDGNTVWYMSAKNKDLSKPPFEMIVRPDDPLHDTLRTNLAKNVANELAIPGLANFAATTWGLSLARQMIADGKRESMVQAAAGRGAPGVNWTGTVDAIRATVEQFTDQQIKDGNTNITRIQPAEWEKIRNSENTINRFGSLYTLMFGSQNMEAILGKPMSPQVVPREPTMPGPQPTTPLTDTLEGERRAAASRAEADPLTRRLIERSFKPPAKPPVNQ